MISRLGTLRYRMGFGASILTLFALAFSAAVSTKAADRFWIDPVDGGSFTSTSNWSTTSGGASGASVPAGLDVAVFDQNGSYTVTFFSNVQNNALEVDRGTVTFDLNNLAYTLSGSFGNEVGRMANTTARLNLTTGALVTDSASDNLEIGTNFESSRGFVTVGQAASLGTSVTAMDLEVGDVGQGTLTVEDGGDAFGRSVIVGNSQNSVGALTVRDLGSTLSTTSTLTIGSNGFGTMSVTGGGRVNSNTTTFLGNGTSGTGHATVSGVGSELAIGGLFTIGGAGNGFLTVSSGARVNSFNSSLGDLVGGAGTVTVAGDGSIWDISGTLDVADANTGLLTVADGAIVRATQLMTLGDNLDSQGRALVSGAGTILESSSLMVGDLGSGELNVSAGARMNTGNVRIGSGAGSTGTATFTGAGTKLHSTSSITVAPLGTGELTIADGAEVDGVSLTINDPAGSASGTLTLDGGTIRVSDGFINNDEFNFHDGTVQTADDFQPQAFLAAYSIDGNDADDLPTLDLTGSGSLINVTSLTVGQVNRGKLIVRQGRSVNLTNNLSIGSFFGSEGTVSVESGGSITTSATVAVGGGSFNAGGAGILEVTSGGEVTAGALRVFASGQVNLDGGTLQFGTIDLRDGAQFNWTTGALQSSGPITISESLVTSLLGPGKTLGLGQVIEATIAGGGEATLNADLTIDGGQISFGRVTNNRTLTIRSGSVQGLLSVTGAATNNGTVILEDQFATFGGNTSALNNGTIRGTGVVTGNLNNSVGGQLQLIEGDRMYLPGFSDNFGLISVLGGELETEGIISNLTDGLISARDAILRFNGGVSNEGGIAFANGTVDVYGDISNNNTARITVSGGGIANFYDDVTISAGAADVQATAIGNTISKVVFFGAYNGGVTGGGQAFIEGDHRPGNSPGMVQFGGDVAYGFFSTLEIEIGGLTPGAEHDIVEVAGQANLSGTLDVVLIDGFNPGLGDVFEILTAAGGLTGEFAPGAMPDIGPLLALETIYESDAVLLVVAPELAGDYNADGSVDAIDYAVWREARGQTGIGLAADGDLSGTVDTADYNLWKANFGAVISSQIGAPTPEPTSLALLSLAIVALRVRLARLR